ncbi:MAG: hypothetical protein HY746_02205 [Elusimicrobia bacterium]|nr:hypothetical protein [Elusimicrobiota bacterium]
MEDNTGNAVEKKKSSKIWLYLIPVYILIAYPLIKWSMKLRSPDINLSKEDYSVFSSSEEEPPAKKTLEIEEPDLRETDYYVRYKTGGEDSIDERSEEIKDKAGRDRADKDKADKEDKKSRDKTGKSSPQSRESGGASEMSEVQKGAMQSTGHTKGYLTKIAAAAAAKGNAKAVGLLFNNKYVVEGFMARDSVKSALRDSKSLENFISNSPVVKGFLNNPMIQSAMASPGVVNAVASSSLMNAILTSPAVSELLKNPETASALISSNPQLMGLLTNPNILNALTSNPNTAGVMSQLNLGGSLPAK